MAGAVKPTWSPKRSIANASDAVPELNARTAHARAPASIAKPATFRAP
jgi:hypothetical protein